MLVELTCDENPSFLMKIEVYRLDFDRKESSFSMPLIMGDDWFQRIICQLPLQPVTVTFEGKLGCVRFRRYQEAAAFGAWLVESDAAVAEGFRTMRG